MRCGQPNVLGRPFIAPLQFDPPVAALAQVRAIYEQSIAYPRAALERFIAGEELLHRVRACYHYVRA